MPLGQAVVTSMDKEMVHVMPIPSASFSTASQVDVIINTASKDVATN